MKFDIEDVIDNLLHSYISKSEIHGNGLFADKDIKINIILGLLDGQCIDWELHKEYDFTLEWNAITKNKLLVRPYRTKYSFINHSRKPNLKIEYEPLRIVTSRDILKNEELTLDYRKEPLPDEYIEYKGNYL